MLRTESDFITWKSFPSSLKLFNDEEKRTWATRWIIENLSVTPGKPLSVKVEAKQEGVLYSESHVWFGGFDGAEWRSLDALMLPLGSFDWKNHAKTLPIPSDVKAVRAYLAGGAGSPQKPGATWFDDLKLYQDGVLIYSNDFSNWSLVIIPAEIITGVAIIKFIK